MRIMSVRNHICSPRHPQPTPQVWLPYTRMLWEPPGCSGNRQNVLEFEQRSCLDPGPGNRITIEC